MRKLTVLVFAIAVAMVVAVAACGSEDPTATPQVSPPTTAPVVEEPTAMAEDPTVDAAASAHGEASDCAASCCSCRLWR